MIVRVDRSSSKHGTHRVVGDGGGGVEDALAALHGAADGVVVQEVGLAEDQPLGRAVQRLEVRVLRVICMPSYRSSLEQTFNRTYVIDHSSASSTYICIYITVNKHAWVPDGALDSVSLLEQHLDEPRGDVPGRAGDAHGLPVPGLRHHHRRRGGSWGVAGGISGDGVDDGHLGARRRRSTMMISDRDTTHQLLFFPLFS